MHFSAAEKEVLGNLYTRHADRMIDLLAEAHINYVWLTWSVGYSWQEEAEQREQVRKFVAKLRGRGIRSGAYVCAVSMFWETMFRDEPRSVRWIRFDPDRCSVPLLRRQGQASFHRRRFESRVGGVAEAARGSGYRRRVRFPFLRQHGRGRLGVRRAYG